MPRLPEVAATGPSALRGAATRLAVYGTLAPGGRHHALVANLVGTWRRGWVTGELLAGATGAARVYPALRWSPESVRVPAHLLESAELPAHWARLDTFEGPAYRRIVVPFCAEDGSVVDTNLYEAAERRAR